MKAVWMVIPALLVVAGPLIADVYSEEPMADTWTWTGYGPYGASTQLRTNIFAAFNQAVEMRFDISAIPAGSTVNSAILNVYRYGGDGSLECDIFRITEYWEEPSLVDSVEHDAANPYDQFIVTGNGWCSFDITQLAQEWIDGTYENYGVVFYGTGGGGSYQYFHSREYSTNKPQLVIDYSIPGAIESTTFASIKALFID